MAINTELRRSNGSLFSDTVYIKSHWSNIDGKPSNFPPTAHTHQISNISGLQDALNNKLNLSGGTVGSLTSRYYFQSTNGEPSINLGNPTITEMALFEEQFDNKLAFYPPNNISFEVFDGSTWDTLETVTELKKKRLVGGDTNADIQIPSGVNQFRITIRSKNSYVYLSALYAYISTQDNYVAIEIWKKRDDGGWIQHTSSPITVSRWPGHIYLPFNIIKFSLSSTDDHYNEIRILFKPTWNNSNYIQLHKLQLWGGYPAEKRRLYSIDENKNAYFPATIYSNNKALVTTDDPRLSDARPASDVYDWAKQPEKPTYTLDELVMAGENQIPIRGQSGWVGLTLLNENNKINSSLLPSYVDDVIEYETKNSFPSTGESGKIYVAKDTNKIYRWSGSSYVVISDTIALGETSSTAYAGDKGKENRELIINLQNSKVDKEDGKGLSTNDFTDYYKTKLLNLPDNDELTNQLDSKASKEDDLDNLKFKAVLKSDFTSASFVKEENVVYLIRDDTTNE